MHKIILVQDFPYAQIIEGKKNSHEKNGIYHTLFLKDSCLSTAKVRIRFPCKLLYYLTKSLQTSKYSIRWFNAMDYEPKIVHALYVWTQYTGDIYYFNS